MPKSRTKKHQMKKLFEDGGLLQEGGTVDEASGNEVPTGSLKKEVRDDIPAQLSEGEFVFPADVVRFIGLQKLMELRQAAKEGLAKMEAIGQMGNADEATEEDTGEFETELDDILDEIENEAEEKSLKKANGRQLKMSAGGAVSQYADPFSAPFSVERYSKEGEKDVFIPTFGGQTQGAVPEGFQKSTKVQSFGGVFRKPEEAQQTVTSTLGLETTAPKKTTTTTATTDTTKTTTTDLTKTEQPIPDTYKGLDTEPTAAEKELPELIDDAGRNYSGNTILKLADQISKNLDRSNIRGGAFNVSVNKDTQIGFKATEAEKILGKMPTAAEMVFLDMARQLSLQGITDISDIKKYKPTEVTEVVSGGEGADTTQVVTKYIDPETGKEFYPNGFGITYAGEGGTGYSVSFDKEGKPKFSTYGEDTSDAGKIAPLLMMATLPFGGIGGIINSITGGAIGTAGAAAGMAGSAVATAGVEGALSQAALTSGSGLIGNLISYGIPTSAATIGANAVFGAVISGLTAAISGGNVGKAMAGGALSGGFGAGAVELSNAVLGPDVVNSISKATSLTPKQVSSVFASSVSSSINTAISGGDFSDVLSSFGTSLVSSGVSEVAASNVVKQLQGTMSKESLSNIGSVTKQLSNVAVNAAMKGLDVNKAIEYYAPSIMFKTLTKTPS